MLMQSMAVIDFYMKADEITTALRPNFCVFTLTSNPIAMMIVPNERDTRRTLRFEGVPRVLFITLQKIPCQTIPILRQTRDVP